MTRVTVILAVCAGAAVAAAGCFVTDTVNHSPSAEIGVVGDGMVHTNSTLQLVAIAGDEDGHALGYAWSAERCDAPGGGGACTQFASAVTSSFDILVDTKQPFTVRLVVRDQRGAETTVERDFTVVNRQPIVTLGRTGGVINPTGCFTASRRIDFFAEANDLDGDPLVPEFQLTVPPASDPGVRESGPGAVAGSYFVRPDVMGNWTLTASVDDGDGGTDEDSYPFCVDADQPPCLSALDPFAPAGAVVIVERDGGPRRFSVEVVQDDLDPYPYPAGTDDTELGSASFAWGLGATGAPPQPVPGHDTHDLLLDPSGYAPGQRLWVRVDVSDRVARPGCDPILEQCGTPGCQQRMTWTVEIR